jgi:hypothetical protein
MFIWFLVLEVEWCDNGACRGRNVRRGKDHISKQEARGSRQIQAQTFTTTFVRVHYGPIEIT